MRIVIIGSGNIAHFFTPRMQKNGHEILQIFSPNVEHAKLLAEANGIGSFTDNPDAIRSDADAYVLAVKDSALSTLNERLSFEGKLVLHCAGAVPLHVIGARTTVWKKAIWQSYNWLCCHLC